MVAAALLSRPASLSTVAGGDGFLSYGAQGESVTQLKGLLNAAGAWPPLRGDKYDFLTLTALREFQSSRGLPTKGYLDRATLGQLLEAAPPSAPVPALDPAAIDALRAKVGGEPTRTAPTLNSPTPDGARPLRELLNPGDTRPALGRAPTAAPVQRAAAPGPTLARGATGAGVRGLQDQLEKLKLIDPGTKRAGYGTFGPATDAGVRELQRSLGLPVNGVVDARTSAALGALASGGVGTKTQANEDVTGAAQRALIKGGYLAAPEAGFGAATEAAVRSFQARNRIGQTGVVGPQTYDALLGRGSQLDASWPVPGYTRINEADKYAEGEGEFGTPRVGGRTHKGLDIQAPSGARVESFRPGEVVFAGQMDGFGNTVVVQHPGGLQTLYAHLGRIDVSEGQAVTADTQLGVVGRTGNVPSTGDSHLHFEVREGADGVLTGTPVDPLRYLKGVR